MPVPFVPAFLTNTGSKSRSVYQIYLLPLQQKRIFGIMSVCTILQNWLYTVPVQITSKI